MTAEEFLAAYVGGQREFRELKLESAALAGRKFEHLYLSGAEFIQCDLASARFEYCNIRYGQFVDCDLTFSTFDSSRFWLTRFDRCNLMGSSFASSTLHRVAFDGSRMEESDFIDSVFVGTSVSILSVNEYRTFLPIAIDWTSIAMSIDEPRIRDIVIRTGTPEVVATYLIDSIRSLDPERLFQMLQSVFISYGGPDEVFARKLYEALQRNGVKTFFFPEHAIPGEKLHRLMRKGVNEYERVILVCSKSSLDRKGVLNEIEETLQREARDGGTACLIPITIDDYIFKDWKPDRPDIAQALRDRVVADFTDDNKFSSSLARLIEALRRRNR